MHLGKGSFENYEGKFNYDFQKNANPTKEKFLRELNGFLNLRLKQADRSIKL
jgi:hypothetical protein